jgi:hypothetical protein
MRPLSGAGCREGLQGIFSDRPKIGTEKGLLQEGNKDERSAGSRYSKCRGVGGVLDDKE